MLLLQRQPIARFESQAQHPSSLACIIHEFRDWVSGRGDFPVAGGERGRSEVMLRREQITYHPHSGWYEEAPLEGGAVGLPY